MAAYDPDNVFAKILRGEIPSERVYEDAGTIAIMIGATPAQFERISPVLRCISHSR